MYYCLLFYWGKSILQFYQSSYSAPIKSLKLFLESLPQARLEPVTELLCNQLVCVSGRKSVETCVVTLLCNFYMGPGDLSAFCWCVSSTIRGMSNVWCFCSVSCLEVWRVWQEMLSSYNTQICTHCVWKRKQHLLTTFTDLYLFWCC